MNFNFDEVSEISNSRKRLTGNQIHEVTFDGCEARDIQGVQDASKVYKVLDIKFHNDEGTFTDTLWPLKESDMQDTPNSFGGLNPSNYKQVMYKILHLIDAVNPELGKLIRLPKDDPKKKNLSITANSITEAWDQLRQLAIKTTEPGIGHKTKIKLLDKVKKNAQGEEMHEAQFPGFYLSYTKDGRLYMSTNFIGDGVYWTTKELNKMKTASTAKPTTTEEKTESSLDFNMDI